MTTNFPTSVDSFPDPSATDRLDNPPHDVLHTNVNSAVEAIETALLDGAPLHIDDVNERVGIGTTAPESTLEVNGILTANPIHGNIAGAVYLHVKNTSGVTIPEGSPVYATGSVGASGATEVAISDADVASTMPALGIVDAELVANAEGHATVLGVAKGLDTSAYSVNDSLYVSTSGGLTNVRPTGASELVQKIGRVIRSDASTGEILVLGAGRSNDVPNNVVAGGLTIDTDTLHVDSVNDRVGIGTTSPAASLTVTSATDDAKVKIDSNGGSVGIIDATANTNDATGRWLSINPSGGNVGIGTTSPSTTLHVDGSILANDSITIGDGGEYVAGSIYSDANWGMIFRAKQASPTQADFRWANSADTEHMRIDSSGRVGIGTSSPASTLHVNGEVQITGNNTHLKGSGNYPNGLNFHHPTTGFWHNSGPRLLEGNRISWYWNNGSTYTEAMSMYPNGHMVKPLQPAFFAYLSGSNPTYGSGWTSLVHNAVVFNVGGTYSTSTKRFTCPTAGRWLFIVTVNYYNSDAGSRFIVHMDKNGAAFSRVWDSNRYTTTTQDKSFTASVIMDLAVGNYVYPSFYSVDPSWNMSAGSLFNSFQGYFLG